MPIRHIAFDVETRLIGPGRMAPRLVCVTTFDGERRRLRDRAEGLELMRELLEDDQVVLVGHKAAFDMAVLCESGGVRMTALVFAAYEAGRVRCTLVREKLIEIANGTMSEKSRYSLEALALKRLGEDISTSKKGPDVWRTRYRELEGIPTEEWPLDARAYAIEDAVLAYKVYSHQTPASYSRSRLAPPDEDWTRWLLPQEQAVPEACLVSPDEHLQTRAAFALHLCGAWGIRVDGESLESLRRGLEKAVAQEMGDLILDGVYVQKKKDGPYSRDLSRVRQLVKEQCTAQNLPVPRTPSGQISTSKEVLAACQGNSSLASLLRISSEQKLLNTYVPLLAKGVDAPIHSYWNVLVKTGRTSCRRPNLQNQPRRPGVRECFVPRPGHVFIACDYHCAELRSLAQVLLDKYGASAMARALLDGQDLHVKTAASILGISYTDALERHHQKDKEVAKMRQLAKALNFGLPGGLGAARFTEFAAAPPYYQTLTLDEAKALKETWLSVYPEMRTYFADIGRNTMRGGDSFTLRQHRSGRLRGGAGYCDGANSYFQGLTADGMKIALWRVTRECYDQEPGSPLSGVRVVAMIHDELILEAPAEYAAEAAKRVEQLMSEGMSVVTPDIPAPAEAALMRRWSKAASDPVHDATGRLIPYEDSLL